MDMYWYKDDQQIVVGLNSTRQVTRYDWFMRDVLPIKLYIVEKQASTNVPFFVSDIEAEESIAFGAKADYNETTFLFSQATWTAQGSGESRYYSADISLNTAELIAAVGTDDFLDIIGEFTVVRADNSNALTTQFNIRVTQDIISGSEGVPTSEYPVVAQYIDDSGTPAVRLVNSEGVAVCLFKNGSPYVFISETGLWYPLTGKIQDGQPTPAFGAGEVI